MQNRIPPLEVTYSDSRCSAHRCRTGTWVMSQGVFGVHLLYSIPFHSYLLTLLLNQLLTGMYLCIVNHPVEISALLKPQRLPWTIFVFMSGLDSAWLISSDQKWNTTTYPVLTVDHNSSGPGCCGCINCRCSVYNSTSIPSCGQIQPNPEKQSMHGLWDVSCGCKDKMRCKVWSTSYYINRRIWDQPNDAREVQCIRSTKYEVLTADGQLISYRGSRGKPYIFIVGHIVQSRVLRANQSF